MEQLKDYQSQRIEALERENAKLQSQLNEAKEILTQLLKDLQDGSMVGWSRLPWWVWSQGIC